MVSGNVTGTDFTGGFVGDSSSDISESWASVVVNGVDYVGGFCGGGFSGEIVNCFSTGSVTGNAGMGGFIGGADNWNEKCYATGAVSGSSLVGGFCGELYYSVTDCYYDINTTGQATSDGGTGKTTAQMQTQSTYSGWDFSDTWVMYIYPELRAFWTDYTYTISVELYDERTGEQLVPGNVSVYDFDTVYEGVTVGNVTTYTVPTSCDRIIIRGASDGYYDRIMTYPLGETLLPTVKMYLISEDEIVVYDKITVTNVYYTYDYTDIIVEISKPMPNGTEVVYSSYLDFSGSTSTYLIASDQYTITIITPDNTISYGWLSPDPDGTIDVVLRATPQDVATNWFEYDIVGDEDTGVITMLYYSDDIDYVTFKVTAYNGTLLYETFATTDNGIFQYVGVNTSEYFVVFNAVNDNGMDWKGTHLVSFVGDGVQPNREELVDDSAPEWVTDIIAMFFITMALMVTSRLSMSVGCTLATLIAAYFWYIGALHVPGMVITALIIITISSFLVRRG